MWCITFHNDFFNDYVNMYINWKASLSTLETASSNKRNFKTGMKNLRQCYLTTKFCSRWLNWIYSWGLSVYTLVVRLCSLIIENKIWQGTQRPITNRSHTITYLNNQIYTHKVILFSLPLKVGKCHFNKPIYLYFLNDFGLI